MLPAPPELLRLSTQMFPERHRTEAFQEAFAQHIVNMDVTDLPSCKARLDLTFLNLGPVAVGKVTGAACEFSRDARHMKDGVGDFHLIVITDGSLQSHHAGKVQSVNTGSGILYHFGRMQRAKGAYAKGRTLTVRATTLKALVAHPEDGAGHIISPGPALHLLNGYLTSLGGLEAPPPTELGPLIGQHLLDLMAAVLGPTAEGREIIAGRGLRAARLRAVLTEIGQGFSDPDLDVDSVAGRLGISRRYVQSLLEGTGRSFTEHVTEHRLQRAYAMLVNPGFSHLRVIDIALATGFSDISHFNRVFRRRFGGTPLETRATEGRHGQS